jgi:hypothetical protein
MKGTTAAFFFGILIIAIGAVWMVSGGPAMGASPATPAFVPTAVPATAMPTPEPVTTIAPPAATRTSPPLPAATIPAPATLVTTGAVPPVKTFTDDDVTAHFLDIAYSSTNRLERLNITSDKSRIILSGSALGDTDTATLAALAREFSGVSPTMGMSDSIKDTDNGDIVIKVVPENGLDNIFLYDIPATGPFNDSLTRREFSYQGKPAAKVLRGTIYLNGNLKGDVRNHTLARCLYYELGVTGETTKYPDSLFYAGENTNTKLNSIDKAAIAILYRPGLANGMTIMDLRKIMYIK